MAGLRRRQKTARTLRTACLLAIIVVKETRCDASHFISMGTIAIPQLFCQPAGHKKSLFTRKKAYVYGKKEEKVSASGAEAFFFALP